MKTSLTFLLLSLAIIASGQVPEYVPQDGLLALFPLSGNASNLVDDSFEADYINVEFSEDEQDSCGTSFARFDAVLGSQPTSTTQPQCPATRFVVLPVQRFHHRI